MNKETKDDFHQDIINIISKEMKIDGREISDLSLLKKGMTNHSVSFFYKNDKYIMRIPGKGTERLINRKAEKEVYDVIKGFDICDEIIYIDSKSGYKIVKYLNDYRNCNPYNKHDLIICMQKLKHFHSLKLKVNHKFNVFEKIEFYEDLREQKESIYNDYDITKKHVFELKDYIERNIDNICLTHIDAVADNFLIDSQDDSVRLIDWEYAGMQDPHIDIAMFCLYSAFDRNQVDDLIDIYFENKCTKRIRLKIYCYISVCGLLWSNWCEYKRIMGLEFADYATIQYQYAKEYYDIFKEEYDA